MKKLNYVTKEKIVKIAGTCFWYWKSFYSFLGSCGIPRSLYEKYPREVYKKFDVMRNILTNLEENGRLDLITKIISEIYKIEEPVDDVQDPEKARNLLKDFKQHVGNDPIDVEIKNRESEEKRREYKKKIVAEINKKDILGDKYKELLELIQGNISPQEKGYLLEKILGEVLLLEEFEYNPPYRTDIEQIDGIFKFEKFDYLIETKFIEEIIKKADLSIFDDKIRSKAQSTRGFFLAMNGFDANHVKDFMGNSPRLVLMEGVEFISILEGRRTFFDVFNRKVCELAKSGNILFKVT